MQFADLLNETLDVDSQDSWENERTRTPVRQFWVRLHTMGLSVREAVAILELLDVDRSQGAVWRWAYRLAKRYRPADGATVAGCSYEAAVQTGTEWS